MFICIFLLNYIYMYLYIFTYLYANRCINLTLFLNFLSKLKAFQNTL